MSVPTPDVIILRGAPGAGKSALSKELAKRFPKGVRLEVDTLRSMVISVDWTNQQEHKDLLQVAAHDGAAHLAHLGDGLAGEKVDERLALDRLVGFAETPGGEMHEYGPWLGEHVVCRGDSSRFAQPGFGAARAARQTFASALQAAALCMSASLP